MKKLLAPTIPDDLSEVESIFSSGNLMNESYVIDFENKVNTFLKKDYFLSCSSYQNALWLTFRAAGLERGDNIVTSPMCCLASTQPLLDYGLEITWCDINPIYGVPGLDEIKSSITKDTKAVVYNCFCGYAIELDDIYSFCLKKNIILIIDAIEAFGSMFKRFYIGTAFCDFAVYNFHTVRTLNSIEGGGVLVNDLKTFNLLKLLRDYGINRFEFRNFDGEISKKTDIRIIGRGAKMNAINAYFGVQNINKINQILDKCIANKKKWDKYFETNPLEYVNPIQIDKHLIHNGWIYGVFTDNFEKTKKYFKNKKIESSKIHYPNHLYSIFPSKDLPGVIKFFNSFIALPSGNHFNHEN